MDAKRLTDGGDGVVQAGRGSRHDLLLLCVVGHFFLKKFTALQSLVLVFQEHVINFIKFQT
jgi:hypothetical protein